MISSPRSSHVLFLLLLVVPTCATPVITTSLTDSQYLLTITANETFTNATAIIQEVDVTYNIYKQLVNLLYSATSYHYKGLNAASAAISSLFPVFTVTSNTNSTLGIPVCSKTVNDNCVAPNIAYYIELILYLHG